MARKLISIVETDDLIRELLERWLADAGFTVQALSGDAGGAADGAEEPLLIIVNVPNPRGMEALIRSLESRHHAPVLVISGRFRRGLGASVEAAHRLGVHKVLPKPFTREELLAAVAQAIVGNAGPRQ